MRLFSILSILMILTVGCSHQSMRHPSSESMDKQAAKPDHMIEEFECELEYSRYNPSMDRMAMEEMKTGPSFSLVKDGNIEVDFKGFKVSMYGEDRDCIDSRLGCVLNLQIDHGDSSSFAVIKLSTKRTPYVSKSSFAFQHGRERLDVRCYFKD